MTKAAFGALLRDPKTGPRLDAMLADNGRVVDEPTLGPRECCADFAVVICCDGETDTWECPFCGHVWTAPCR